MELTRTQPLGRTRATVMPRYDVWLLAATLCLVGIGLVMVFSASAVSAQEKMGSATYFFVRQLVAALIGVGAMSTTLALGYRRVARYAYPVLVVAVVLLVLVVIPQVGTLAGGARRWIRLGFFSIQPAEIAKVAWVGYLAYSLAKKKEKVASFSIGFLPHLLIAMVLVGLCMAEPDFGSAVVLLVLMFVLLFAAGARLSYLVGSVLVALPFAYHAIASSPYRLKRVLAFLDPWAHRHDAGYQVAESLMSIGSGGLTGLGLGDGRQKLYFLPEAHNDFIFSIIGEELGLVGVVVLLALYAVFVWRGIRAAARAPEPFGCYLALGVTALVAVQAVANMAVAMGLLPTKGLTLPFVSYGGSSLVVLMAAVGVLLSVSGGSPEARRGRPVEEGR